MAPPVADPSQTVRLRALFQSLLGVPLWIGCAASAGSGCSNDDDPADKGQVPLSDSGTRARGDSGPRGTDPALGAGRGSDGGGRFDASTSRREAGLHTLPTAGGAYDGGSDGWQHVVCDDQQDKAALVPGPLRLTRPVGFLGLYDTAVVSSDDQELRAYKVALTGVACSDVDQQTQCIKRLRGVLSAAACSSNVDCAHTVIEGTGAEFRALSSRQELLDLLGSVDTAGEAILLAMYDDRLLGCAPEFDRADEGLQVRSADGGHELANIRDNCQDGVYRYTRSVAHDGTITLAPRVHLRAAECTIGRRPLGLCADASSRGAHGLGFFWAQAATLEAASVYAFRQLARELLALAAPAALIAAAVRAIDDELRHTHQVAQLARRYGAEPSVPDVRHGPDRSVHDVALDNAVEGCVRETYGALLATYQAQAARDPEVRRVMQQIASDETEHAQLSWDLAAWLRHKLDPETRQTLRRAQRRAVESLAGELDCDLTAAEQSEIGYPSAARGAELLQALDRALFL